MDNKKNHGTINNENRSNNTDKLKHESNRTNIHKEISNLETLTTPHRCNVCNRTFAKMVTLKYHLMRHLGIRDYVCHMCDKRFVRNDNLKTHMRVHTGEKPYHCHLCVKRFTKKVYLVKHLQIHTKQESYQQKSNDSNNNVAIGIVQEYSQIQNEIDKSYNISNNNDNLNETICNNNSRIIVNQNKVSTNKIDSFNKSYSTIQTNLKESIKVEEDSLKIEHDNFNKSIDDEHDNFNDPLNTVNNIINDGNEEEFQMNNQIIKEINKIKKQSNDILKEEKIEIEEHSVKIEDPLENDTNEKLAHNQTSLFVKGAKRIIEHSLKTVLAKPNNKNLNVSTGNEINSIEQSVNFETNLIENVHCPNDENNQNRIIPGSDNHKHMNSHVTKQRNENFDAGCIPHQHLEKHVQNATVKVQSNEEQPKKLPTRNQLYHDKICTKQCGQKCNLENHATKKLYHHCNICKRKFLTIDQLKRHLKVHSYKKQSCCCNICGEEFLRKNDLLRHLIKHSDKRPYQCEVCDKKFDTKTTLNDHLNLHIRKNPYFLRKTHQKIQKIKQTDRKPSNIDAPQHHTNSTENTKITNVHQKHVETYPEDELQSKKPKPYECETCFKRFPQEHLLRKHIQFLHYVRKSYECNSCERSFLTKRQLSLHSIEHAKRHDGSNVYALQEKTNNRNNGSISRDNKSNNNQMVKNKTTTYNVKNSITIEKKNEVSMEEAREQSPEKLSNLSSPTIKINLEERIQEQPLKTTTNDKTENNSNNKTNNIQNSTNDANECKTNTNKKLSQINGVVDDSSTTAKIVSEIPIDKDRENLNESIDGNETNTTITGEELFECEACHTKFSQDDLLVTHVKSVHANQKFYKCEICQKNFLTVHQLPSHTVEHSIHDHNLEVCIYKNPFSNDKSDKKFIYMAYLKTYIKEKSFQCNTCGKQFPSKKRLNFHSAIHKKAYQCDICGKRFAFMGYLRAHLRWHTGEKPYCCNKCGKRFVDSSLVNGHMRLHHGVKLYQCEICGKKFSTNSILHQHFIVQTGEKAHQCNVCLKKFARVSKLRVHSTVHTGEQPYCCNTCGKRFSRKDNLRTHSKIHSGEKPFQCNICDKRFLYKHVLRDHLKVHTGERSFDCNKCNVSFLQRSDLSIHMKREHKKK